MAEQDRILGGMVEPSMGAGGPDMSPEEALQALIELEGQAPGIMDEAMGAMSIRMNEDGSAEVFDPEEEGQEVLAEEYSHTANLAEILDERVLGELSSELLSLFEDDLDSRSEWEDAIAKGLDLLGVGYEERDEPFIGASGVTHPLISESVTQFQAQAYKELLPAGGPVRTAVVGDETPEAMAQATRVKNFMNYYVTEVMEEYDPDMDQMLFFLPLSGSTFKKVYYDPARGRAVSRFVPAEDLVVPYYASDIRTAERVTHVVTMSENDIIRMQMATVYREVDLSSNDGTDSNEVRNKKDDIQGLRPSSTDDMYTILEMHTYLDLPGFEDTDADGEPTGLKLPYVVTIDRNSGQILNIVRNWDEEDQFQKPMQYFVHYKFLPGLGFYGFGLVHMIGGLSRAASSILRQLIDAGTLSNLPAGFKARGVRIRNDDEPIQPGEFRDIDAPGGDIRNSMMPLPYKEPSGTLANLLGVLVDSGRRYASIADANIQDVNQQMPVGTTVALLERGSRVMSAIHKRMHYAQKQEFRLLANIIADTIDSYPYQMNVPGEILAQDFDARIDVLPVSDPNIFSMAQRMSLAQTQLQMATQNPEVHNLREAYRRMYEALEVKNIDAILKPEPQPQPADPATEIALMLEGQPTQPFPGQNHMAHIQSLLAFYQLPMTQNSPLAGVVVMNVQKRIGMMAQEQVQQQVMVMQQQAMQQAMAQGAPPQLLQQMQQQPPLPPEQIQQMVTERASQLTVEIMPQFQPPKQDDPLVGIRQAEVQIQAQEQQRKAQKDQIDAMLEQARLDQQSEQARNRLKATMDIAESRNEVNMTRIETQEDIAVMRELNKKRQ